MPKAGIETISVLQVGRMTLNRKSLMLHRFITIAGCAYLAQACHAGEMPADPEFARVLGEVSGNMRPKLPFGDEISDCVGDRILSSIGAKRLAALGIDKETVQEKFSVIPLTDVGFSKAEAGSILDALDECVSFIRIWDYVVQNGENVERVAVSPKNKEALSQCVHEVIGNESVRHVFDTMFTRSRAAFQDEWQELSNKTMDCFEAVFCGSTAILGSMNVPMTTAPSGLAMGGIGSGGVTMIYSTPILMSMQCPFTLDKKSDQ